MQLTELLACDELNKSECSAVYIQYLVFNHILKQMKSCLCVCTCLVCNLWDSFTGAPKQLSMAAITASPSHERHSRDVINIS